jgi:cell division protein ZapA (FtsZ GTPase activity inhibitor)
MQYYFLTLLATFAILSSCDNKKDQVEILGKQTMAVHDESMKDLAAMNRVARALKDTLGQLDTSAAAVLRRTAILDALSAIKQADEGMNTWMRQYENPSGKPAEQALQYLREQKQKIEQNHKDILTATENAKQLIKK